jgi:hypothetical protein
MREDNQHRLQAYLYPHLERIRRETSVTIGQYTIAYDSSTVATELWNCSCRSDHDYMLFLATHRRFKEHNSHVPFDLLFRTLSLQGWRESKVFVMLSDHKESRVQFELPDSCQPRAPAAKQLIQSLCTQL